MRHCKSTKSLFAYKERAKYSENLSNSRTEKAFPQMTITAVYPDQEYERGRKPESKRGKVITDERNIILDYRIKKREDYKTDGKNSTQVTGLQESLLYRSLSRRRIDISGNEIVRRLGKRGALSPTSPPLQNQFALNSSSYSSFGSERYLATPRRKYLKQLYSEIHYLNKNASCFTVPEKKDEIISGKNRRQVHAYLCCCCEEKRRFNLPSVE